MNLDFGGNEHLRQILNIYFFTCDVIIYHDINDMCDLYIAILV